MWLSVWSKVQTVCIWSSWCHCIPKPHHLLPHLNPDWFYLSGTGLPRLSWIRGRSTGVVVVNNIRLQHLKAVHTYAVRFFCAALRVAAREIVTQCISMVRSHILYDNCTIYWADKNRGSVFTSAAQQRAVYVWKAPYIQLTGRIVKVWTRLKQQNREQSQQLTVLCSAHVIWPENIVQCATLTWEYFILNASILINGSLFIIL